MKRRTKQKIGWILAVIFGASFLGALVLIAGWKITLVATVFAVFVIASIGGILYLIDPPTP